MLMLLCLLPGVALQADPRSHYMIHCMGCHLADGSGQPPDVPVFDRNLGLMVQSAAGRAYMVRVPGAAQAPIDDDALASVINWMLIEYSPTTIPENFVPYDAEEVARYRRQILANPIEFKASLITGTNGTL